MRDGRDGIEHGVLAQGRLLGADPLGVAAAERVVGERARAALVVVDHRDLEQRPVGQEVLGELADEGDVVDHLRGDPPADVADDDRVAESPSPRKCAGSTRGSRQVITNRRRLGNTTAPSCPPAAANARLRASATSMPSASGAPVPERESGARPTADSALVLVCALLAHLLRLLRSFRARVSRAPRAAAGDPSSAASMRRLAVGCRVGGQQRQRHHRACRCGSGRDPVAGVEPVEEGACSAALWIAAASPGMSGVQPACPATVSAAPTDAWAVRATRPGRPAGSALASRLAYSDAYTLPITATPRVPPEQPRGVVDRRADAGLGLRDDAHDRLGRGRAGEPHPGPEHDHLRSDRPVAGVGRGGRDPRVERSHQEQPARDDELRAGPDREPRAEHRGDRHAARDRQQAHTGRQRAVALQELEVLGDEEDEAGQGEERDRDGRARGGETRVARTALTSSIGCSVRRSQATNAAAITAVDAKLPSVRALAPAVVRGLDDRVDEQRDHRGRQHEPRAVGCAALAGRARSGHSRPRARRRAPRPGSSRRRCSASRDASSSQPPTIGPSAIATPVIAPHRPIASARSRRIGEHVREQRERRREHHRRADAHHRARRDQLAGAVRQAADEARHTEHRQAGEQHALAPEAVGEAAHRQHRCREQKVERVDDPLQLGVGRVQIAHQRRAARR